ncbi:4Fe-4S ferredoxin, iron-sulfur binding protein [Sulfobacillus acidophilus TPY]|nr:4Fe-4S ferredoxin, iron-sulfur binding protein [Sulfobacillus acidophilus TPY]
MEVCPVDCIHPASDIDGPEAFAASPQLYIDPEVCIDCGACVPVCPVEAIFYMDEVPPEEEASIEENRRFYHA